MGFPGNVKSVDEGRAITLTFPHFSVSSTFVPSSGKTYASLQYRTQTWDSQLLDYHNALRTSTSRPVMWCGNLSVVHSKLFDSSLGSEEYEKIQPTVTREERANFSMQLNGGPGMRKNGEGYIDAFRYLNPVARGHFTYWHGPENRAENKGVRLDKFVCSDDMIVRAGQKEGEKDAILRDCYMVQDMKFVKPDKESFYVGEHCPIMAVFECGAGPGLPPHPHVVAVKEESPHLLVHAEVGGATNCKRKDDEEERCRREGEEQKKHTKEVNNEDHTRDFEVEETQRQKDARVLAEDDMADFDDDHA